MWGAKSGARKVGPRKVGREKWGEKSGARKVGHEQWGREKCS